MLIPSMVKPSQCNFLSSFTCIEAIPPILLPGTSAATLNLIANPSTASEQGGLRWSSNRKVSAAVYHGECMLDPFIAINHRCSCRKLRMSLRSFIFIHSHRCESPPLTDIEVKIPTVLPGTSVAALSLIANPSAAIAKAVFFLCLWQRVP